MFFIGIMTICVFDTSITFSPIELVSMSLNLTVQSHHYIVVFFVLFEGSLYCSCRVSRHTKWTSFLFFYFYIKM